MKQEAVVEIERKHAAEMAVMHERLRASCADKAEVQERLIKAEAHADHLEFQLKRTEEVVAGQTARIQEILATAQRERVDLERPVDCSTAIIDHINQTFVVPQHRRASNRPRRERFAAFAANDLLVTLCGRRIIACIVRETLCSEHIRVGLRFF